MANWVKDAVFYEIYPNSFRDTNGDGYGDFNGIIEKLDYIKDLGCNAIWLNPCFDSPFMDGGYDVRDFMAVSSRFGTMQDFEKMVAAAKNKGIRIILDLVAGHASEENEMFLKSARTEENDMTHRFVWTDNPWSLPDGYRLISGRHQRNGTYLVNFFATQPALNYGFNVIEYPEWQKHYTHPECMKTREWLKDVIRFWLAKGVDGFRVDMADSLIKNDDEKKAVIELWQDISGAIKKEYPESILVSEWSYPERSIAGGFDIDFLLDHGKNFYHTLARAECGWDDDKYSVFDKEGRGDISKYLDIYLKNLKGIGDKGYLGMITCNHDTPRPSRYLDEQGLKLFYTMIFTLPGVPFLYYGDEIGMKYIENLPSVECGFHRTGTRTPMQWSGEKNAGFSDAAESKLFLPVDKSADAPNVESQLKDKDSLLNFTKKIIAFRNENQDLKGNNFQVLYMEKNKFPIIYRRNNLVVAINPTDKQQSCKLDISGETVFSEGGQATFNKNLTMQPRSACIIRVDGKN